MDTYDKGRPKAYFLINEKATDFVTSSPSNKTILSTNFSLRRPRSIESKKSTYERLKDKPQGTYQKDLGFGL